MKLQIKYEQAISIGSIIFAFLVQSLKYKVIYQPLSFIFSQTLILILICVLLLLCCFLKKKKMLKKRIHKSNKINPVVADESKYKCEINNIFWTQPELKFCVTGTPIKPIRNSKTSADTSIPADNLAASSIVLLTQ